MKEKTNNSKKIINILETIICLFLVLLLLVISVIVIAQGLKQNNYFSLGDPLYRKNQYSIFQLNLEASILLVASFILTFLEMIILIFKKWKKDLS